MLNKIKSYMMPIAMLTCILLHKYMGELSFLTPYLIALMLLMVYLKHGVNYQSKLRQ